MADEIEYWQQVVLFSVLDANPPLKVIKGFIKYMWATMDINKILHVRKGVFLVRFDGLHDKQMVQGQAVYYFDSKPFLVKGQNPGMDMHTEAIKSLPLWVQFLNSDVKY